MTTAGNTERNDIELPPDDVGVKSALGRRILSTIRNIATVTGLLAGLHRLGTSD
jgi:hypothetical protein